MTRVAGSARAGLVATACTLLSAATPTMLAAQLQSPPPPGSDSVWATPRGRYDAGFLHRFLLSSGHRTLWATPVRAAVLDLDSFAGGLTPDRLGGGQQTRSLRFRGADGREYAFRSIDKDASRTLDPELRGSIAARVLQDQIGSLLPLGALVVAPLVEAAGVLYVQPNLFVMPDDPRLGEFRAEFAGMLGFVEERPDEGAEDTSGFAGSNRITGTERFLEHIEETPRNRLDDEDYLRARLIDILVGDWDRHPDQWRWAAYERGEQRIWRPIPRDRDWALARMDGLVIALVPFGFPQYVGFGRDYPSAFRLTWSARALDRRLLSGLSRERWDTVVADLTRRLGDPVIENAVRRLPEPYYERIGAELTAALKNRRDHLPRVAGDFYRLLAGWTEIRATDERDLAELTRLDDGRLRVTIESGAAGSDAPYFQRTFDPAETHEVRVFMHGGADHVAVLGAGPPEIRLRVLGGGGDDQFIDRTSGSKVHFYDDRGSNRFERARHTSVDETSYVQPWDASSETAQARARDWGSQWAPIPAVSYDPDLGLFVGAGAVRYGYGFRYYPYRTRFSASVGFGTNTGRIRADLSYDFPLSGNALRSVVHARWSGAELDRFYGLGNETASTEPDEFYEAQRREVTLEWLARAEPAPGLHIAAGPTFTAIRPLDSEGTLLDQLNPYGYSNFDQLGVTAALSLDRRDVPRGASRGVYLGVRGDVYPGVLDVDETFGSVAAEAALYVGSWAPWRPVVALRGGGEKVWGRFPFHEAAYLGGRGTLRGFPTRRFAGEASLFGNAELRLTIANHELLVPGMLGLLGLADAGRVFVDGESSDLWHTGVGGGFWISFHGSANTFSATVARSDERTAVYVGAGFSF